MLRPTAKWVTEVHKAKEPAGMNLPVDHGRELAGTVGRVPAQGVPGSHGLCKSQVDDLKELRRDLPIQIKLSEHCRMESVMHRGSNLCREDWR